MRGTESSDGITQSFDAIKLDTSYGLMINHGIDRVKASTVIDD
jgi:hypothetical protein